MSAYATNFGHVYNQYLDNFAKQGIIGLLELLSVFIVLKFQQYENNKKATFIVAFK